MQNLAGIGINFNTSLQQPGKKSTSRIRRRREVGYPGDEQPYANSACDCVLKGLNHSPAWSEISGSQGDALSGMIDTVIEKPAHLSSPPGRINKNRHDRNGAPVSRHGTFIRPALN